ncbi:hypothetical protein BBJ28_00014412 [Nothophytophthora sp. Chile5]|nr:hypothetical protein BBJ28_00014412 [Nothophytophthora sp. Chile5]
MADADEDSAITMPPWKMLKTSAPSGASVGVVHSARAAFGGVNRFASVAVPYAATDPVTTTYFQVVISKAKAPIVCGDAGPTKGKAIYADRDLPRATRIWTESPFVAMQEERNRSTLPCCQYCYLPLLSDAQRQWQDIVARWNAQVAQSQTQDPTDRHTEAKATTTTTTEAGQSEAETLAAVDEGDLDAALRSLNVSPQNCGLSPPGARCSCGEIYCSKLCRMRAFHEYHAILCPRNDPCSAMGDFLEHMRHTNDIFLLVAKVIARILSRYLVWRDIVKAREPIDMFYKKPWWEVVVVEHDQHEKLWHLYRGAETAEGTSGDAGSSNRQNGTSPNDVECVSEEKPQPPSAEAAASTTGQREQQLKTEGQVGERREERGHDSAVAEGIEAPASVQTQCLQEVLTLTHQLLVDALECNLVRLEREDQLRGVTVREIWRCCSSVLNFEFFAAQLGLFEMNNISLEVDHPFHAFIDILDPEVQSDSTNGHQQDHVQHSDAQSPRLDLQLQLTTEDQTVLGSVRRVLEWEEERLQRSRVEQQVEEKASEEEDGTVEPAMLLGFPNVEGTALFPIICTMNHSCDPNCTVLYTKNGDAHVVAIRDIQKGEELCICYIDVDMDLQMREANLREYKFKCFCSRCVEERQQLEQQTQLLEQRADRHNQDRERGRSSKRRGEGATA